MTLSIGYLGAALGPWLAGVLHDATGGWSATLAFLLAVTCSSSCPGCRRRATAGSRARARRCAGLMPGVPELVAPVVPAGRLRGQEQPRLTVDELVSAPGSRRTRALVVEASRDPAIRQWHARSVSEAEAAA